MHIQWAKVANFRCHETCLINFRQPKTMIIGANGSGKTSILEAIYVGYQGKSFKASDRDLIRDSQDWYRIDLQSTIETEPRKIKYQLKPNLKTKKFIINNQTNARLLAKNRYPIVLFEPSDLNLISGSPSRRRRYVDNIAGQIFADHQKLVNRYEKILRQRNNLISQNLKNNQLLSFEDLFSWNVLLSQTGARIIKNRLVVIEEIQAAINQVYHQISQVKDSLSVCYSANYDDYNQIEQMIFKQLTTNHQNLYQTAVGPHRDDVIIEFNECLACNQASRGENRSLILSLKIIEAQMIKKMTGLKPIILLDDVLSELDERRQKRLVDFDSQSQLIITTTDNKLVNKFKNIEIIKL